MSSLAIKVRHPRQFRYLIEDARRDWRLAAAARHSAANQAGWIRQADGILFASYATLRSGTGEKTRPAIAGMAHRISTA
jgi:hypothetical protein